MPAETTARPWGALPAIDPTPDAPMCGAVNGNIICCRSVGHEGRHATPFPSIRRHGPVWVYWCGPPLGPFGTCHATDPATSLYCGLEAGHEGTHLAPTNERAGKTLAEWDVAAPPEARTASAAPVFVPDGYECPDCGSVYHHSTTCRGATRGSVSERVIVAKWARYCHRRGGAHRMHGATFICIGCAQDAVRDALDRPAAPPPPPGEDAADEEREKYQARVQEVVGVLAGGVPPKCRTCNRPATCVGYGERPENLDFGCDECCGHGNEDGWCVPLAPGEAAARESAGEERARVALQKINGIRNSIIAAQTVNWSEHVYPLVAALNEAGLAGMPYPEALAYYGTMLERTLAAEARAEKAEAALRAAPASPPARAPAEVMEEIEGLVSAMEDAAARYGTAAEQPLGVEVGPNGERHTRHNRDVLRGLSGGLNEAATMARERAVAVRRALGITDEGRTT